MKNASLIIFFLFIGLNTSFGQTEQKIPSAQVTTLDGETIDFNSVTKPGKNYVISFWATWCVPCKKELSNMVDLSDDWKEKFNTEIIAVSTDDSRAKSKVKSFVMGEEWPFQIILDQNQDLMRALGIQQIPHTIIVDENGNIIYKHSSYVEGDEYEIENKLMDLYSKQ